jgi:hypothetical protein
VRSDALLARFEGCLIDQVKLELRLIQPGATLAFVNCTLTDIMDRSKVEVREYPNVLFPGSKIEFYTGEWSETPRKDLNEIFPDWQERIEQ